MERPKWPNIALHRAIGGRQLTITIAEEITEADDTIGDRAAQNYLHRSEAARLLDALTMALPGGTLDMLLIELLEVRKSRLLVPLTPPTVGDRAEVDPDA
jgi:hypothetical protein